MAETQAEQRENNIFHKLKELARSQQYGKMKCEVLIKEGHVIEIRPEVMVGVIR